MSTALEPCSACSSECESAGIQQADPSSIKSQAARGSLSLGAFRLMSHVISWLMTIVIVRILAPEDYGLMAMATILTGYVEIFGELGMGAAIVQKYRIEETELSSNFWFSLVVACCFGLVAMLLAYPTAWLFDEPRVIRLTQAVSVLFVIGGLKVVPTNILLRDLRFRAVGAIQLVATIISSVAMLLLAFQGWGVWTLIGGVVALRLVDLLLSFIVSGWMPRLWFEFKEIRPYLRFGFGIVGTRSLFYVFQNSDRFIVGKVLGTEALGYYSLALTLANLPLEKSMSILGQVALPLFSRLQNNLEHIRDTFTSLTKYTMLIIAPLYLGGAAFGDHVIQGILGDKWAPIVFLFRVMCVVQFIGIAVSLSNVVNYAMGRTHWAVLFYGTNVLLVPPAIYVAVHYGLNSIAIPWLAIYPILCGCYVFLTVRAVKLPLSRYVREGFSPTGASLVMILGMFAFQAALPLRFSENVTNALFLDILSGVLIYVSYQLTFNRASLKALINLRVFG